MLLSSKKLSTYLRNVYSNAAALDKLKIVYRPYICPFGALIEECKDSKSIFDLGCGSGQFLLLLSQYSNANKLGGVEISATLVDNAKELLSNQTKTPYQIEIYNGEDIPDFIAAFDTVTLIDVFHHVEKKKQEAFVKELYKKMKVGSKLIFKDINAAHPFVIMNKIHDMFLGGGSGKEMSFSNAQQMLLQTGFKINSSVKKTMLWYPHYTISCSK